MTLKLRHCLPQKIILLSSLLVCLLATSQRAEAHDLGGADLLLVSPLYWQESNFTRTPSRLGGSLALVPACAGAGAGALVGYTIGLPFGQQEKTAFVPAALIGLATLGTANTVAGAPFYVVEKVFFDLPAAIAKSHRSSQVDDIY